MKAKEFDEILDRRLSMMRNTMASKAGEYASDADRLHNFKQAAGLLGSTPAMALLGMLVKHWSSVMDLASTHESLSQDRVNFMIDEKIGDCCNYLVLLEALIRESAAKRKGQS